MTSLKFLVLKGFMDLLNNFVFMLFSYHFYLEHGAVCHQPCQQVWRPGREALH